MTTVTDKAQKVKSEVSERVRRLREKKLVPPAVCIERAYLITESYKETESEPAVIRRAKAMEKCLKEMSIRIEDGELIVGWITTKERGSALVPEVRSDWILPEMESISTRDWDRYAPLTEEEKTKLKEIIPYWKGKALADKWFAMLPESAKKLNHMICVGVSHSEQNFHHGHMCVDYEKVITKGLNHMKKQVNEELGKLDLARDLEKYHFLRAVNISLEAVISYAKRYADLARSMAAKETDGKRKAELEKIAEICEWVPVNPARNFHEALQAYWFTYVGIMVEAWSVSIAFGRPDQMLYPYYKEDIYEGRITKEEARELIALFLIKIAGQLILQSNDIVKNAGGPVLIADLTLGGVTKDGKDSVNELSCLFLEAEKYVGLSAEDLIIRVNKRTPDAFLMKACEVAKSLKGKLKFVSDDTIIQALVCDGKPIEYARNYVIAGCYNIEVPGFARNLYFGMLNLPLMLDLALNNGVSRVTGEQIGPKTGDPRKFKSYEEVWEAYKKLAEALIPVACLFRNADQQVFAQFAPTPYLSALFQGCIEKGLDVNSGGTAPYEADSIGLGGAPNVGDSLAAIKKAVFEDKKITMDRLIDALDKNFEGEEEILRMLEGCPKFGNDDDYVDSIVNDVLMHASSEVAKHRGYPDSISNTAAGIATANVPLGYIVGALPDGRRAGEPLSEGGISPYQGRNVSGPTATMRSVAKIDHLKMTGGWVLNMKFHPDAVKDESKTRKLVSLIRTFCETGGGLVQFNFIGSDTLREAQRHPEKYRDLLVRVATYSAYFVELSPELQNDIIARIEFEEV